MLTLADYYGVSLEALTLRLEDLSLLPPGVWERLKSSGLRVREAQAILNLQGAHEESVDALPLRYQRLAVMAYQQGEISQGRLAQFLRTDPTTAWEIAERLGTFSIVDEEGQVKQHSLDLGEAVGAPRA